MGTLVGLESPSYNGKFGLNCQMILAPIIFFAKFTMHVNCIPRPGNYQQQKVKGFLSCR